MYQPFATDRIALDSPDVASMSRNGHVREAAVRRLAKSTDGSEVPFLLVCVNDWVSPVREAALAALQARLRPEYAGHFVRNLPLVIRLADCGRHDHAPFVAAVLDQLRAPESRPALLEGLTSADRAVRRLCFRLAIETADIPRLEFLGQAIRDDDPSVRLWAARTAGSTLGLEDYLDLTAVMARDRFMPVRRQALVGLVEMSPEHVEPVLRASLLDPHVSIREIARYHLAKSGGFDARSFYRAAVYEGRLKNLSSALAGLGETGTREDAKLVEPWLSQPNTKIRRAAARALGRLDGDSHIDDLLRALEDDRPNVSRAAKDALRGRLRLIAPERLWQVFERDRRSHARRHSLGLLAGLGKWERLPYLIRACSDDDPEIAARAHRLIADWFARFNRSFTPPSPENLRRISTALETYGPAMEPEAVMRLREYLKGW
ncbi:HEAT repeat domain-containing protein [Paludisphaera borealis]|uniref:HEAT repeat domain-containing protein n=1 Tax=Paludisphaera borealis TaxID=1387353 RepID=UPI0011AB61D0|nr:HEAT repeat domain-containing protein [Paludisphaera borealis]